MSRPRLATVSANLLSWLIPPLLVVGLVCRWVGSTAADSERFAGRTVQILDSANVRRELATQITNQLVRSGDTQAGNFRPAYQLAIEALTGTDTFRALFRDALRQAHHDLLIGTSEAATLDLSATLGLLSSSLQLTAGQASQANATGKAALTGSFPKLMATLSSARLVDSANAVQQIGWVLLALTFAAAAAVIAVHPVKRRGLSRVGAMVAVSGVGLLLTIVVTAALIGRNIASDTELASSLTDGLLFVQGELAAQAGWLIAIAAVMVLAATTAGEDRPVPTWRELTARLERVDARLQRRIGTGRRRRAVIAAALIAIGIASATHVNAVVALIGSIAALAVMYCGFAYLAALWPRPPRRRHPALSVAWRAAKALTGLVVVLALVGGAVGAEARSRARSVAIDTPAGACNGSLDNCSRRLDEVIFAGSHNAMSASLEGEWLFPEHNLPILRQLRLGVRALLIDTHLGIASSVRVPGFRQSVVATDRAAEAAIPNAEPLDPIAEEQARKLATTATAAAGKDPEIYLCHNFCELGSVRFAEVLGDLNRFLDANPREVVMLLIQDAVDPARTVAAFDAAGLTTKAGTLTKGQPLPTLQQLIDARHQLLVFVESTGTGGPPWYHHMYDGWFSETTYKFSSTSEFGCRPNRGAIDAPLFLVNHWLEATPPDQQVAAAANADAVLAERLRQCASARHRVPNVVAVDFEDRGALFTVTSRDAADLRQRARAGSG
jgi:hypothetical protein